MGDEGAAIVIEIDTILTIGGWLVAAIALVLNFFNTKRGADEDTAHAAAEMTEVKVMLKTVVEDVQELKTSMSLYRESKDTISTRLALTENKTDRAHERLDAQNERIDGLVDRIDALSGTSIQK